MRQPRGWGHKKQTEDRGGTKIDFRDTRKAVLRAYHVYDLADPISVGAITWRLTTTDNLINEQIYESKL